MVAPDPKRFGPFILPDTDGFSAFTEIFRVPGMPPLTCGLLTERRVTIFIFFDAALKFLAHSITYLGTSALGLFFTPPPLQILVAISSSASRPIG